MEREEGGWTVTILAGLTFAGMVVGLIIGGPWWISLILGVSSILSLGFAVFEEWAPKNFIVTIVPEGTFKVVTRGGNVVKILLCWKGHRLATKEDVESGRALKVWDIIEDPSRQKKKLGGFAFVGFPPLNKVYCYNFAWTSFRGGKGVRPHDEILDYGLVKWDTYVMDISKETEGDIEKGIEDVNGVPLGITVLFPMRIVNPYEALFLVEHWLPAVMGVLQPPFRRFIGRHSYRELISMQKGKNKNLLQEFWKEVSSSLKERERKEEDNIITVLQDKPSRLRIYGIEIDKARSGLLNVDPASLYRRLSTKKYEAEQEGLAEQIRREAKGRGVSKELTAAIWGVAKQLAGLSEIPDKRLTAEQQKVIQELIPIAWQNYLAEQGVEAIKPTDKVIITGGAAGIGSDLAGLTLKEVIRQEMAKKKEE